MKNFNINVDNLSTEEKLVYQQLKDYAMEHNEEDVDWLDFKKL